MNTAQVHLLLAEGFLPFRGSIMLDVVFLAMFAILPAMGLGVWLARTGRHRLHRTVQLTMAVVLLVAVVLFEIDMRFFTDWRKLAAESAWVDWCPGLLYLHMAFAVPTPFLWGWIIVGALRHFDDQFQAPEYRESHRRLGWCGVLMMTATAVTGISFYCLAFIW